MDIKYDLISEKVIAGLSKIKAMRRSTVMSIGSEPGTEFDGFDRAIEYIKAEATKEVVDSGNGTMKVIKNSVDTEELLREIKGSLALIEGYIADQTWPDKDYWVGKRSGLLHVQTILRFLQDKPQAAESGPAVVKLNRQDCFQYLQRCIPQLHDLPFADMLFEAALKNIREDSIDQKLYGDEIITSNFLSSEGVDKVVVLDYARKAGESSNKTAFQHLMWLAGHIRGWIVNFMGTSCVKTQMW